MISPITTWNTSLVHLYMYARHFFRKVRCQASIFPHFLQVVFSKMWLSLINSASIFVFLLPFPYKSVRILYILLHKHQNSSVLLPRSIHPASRGVAAHTAVVLRQFQGPKRGSEACGHRIIFCWITTPFFPPGTFLPIGVFHSFPRLKSPARAGIAAESHQNDPKFGPQKH